MSWEERMAAGSASHVFMPPLDDACEIEDPDYRPGHYGHHTHVQGNADVCSCGEIRGIFSIALEPGLWSDNPAKREQAEREECDFIAWVQCDICGQRGVVNAEHFGIWPPRRAPVHSTA